MSNSSSESKSEEEDSSEDEDNVSREYLDSLLEKARRSIASKATQKTVTNKGDILEEDMIGLDGPETGLKCVILYLFLRPSSHLIPEASHHWTQALYHHPTSRLGKRSMTRRWPFGT
jgi:hypothetical protein